MIPNQETSQLENWQQQITQLSEEKPDGWLDNTHDIYLQMMSWYEQQPEKFLEQIGYCAHEIGHIHYKKEQYEEAKTYAQKALTTILQLSNDAVSATLYSNLGKIYDKLNEAEQALDSYRQALEIHLKSEDASDEGIANCFEGVGSNLEKLERHEEAAAYLLKALDIRKRHQETDPVRAAECYDEVALNYVRRSHQEEAMKYYLEALHIRQEAFGMVHPVVIGNYEALASICMTVGDHTKAIDYTRRSLDTRLKVWGENDEGVAMDYDILALLYDLEDKQDLVLSCLLKRLDILTTLGDDVENPDFNRMCCHDDLAKAYEKLGRYEEALFHIPKAMELDRKIYGENRTESYYKQMGDLYQRLGKTDEASDCFQKAEEAHSAMEKE